MSKELDELGRARPISWHLHLAGRLSSQMPWEHIYRATEGTGRHFEAVHAHLSSLPTNEGSGVAAQRTKAMRAILSLRLAQA